jgi:hypothetical protein
MRFLSKKKIFDGQPQSLYKPVLILRGSWTDWEVRVTWRVGRATGMMQGQRKWFDGAQKPARAVRSQPCTGVKILEFNDSATKGSNRVIGETN